MNSDLAVFLAGKVALVEEDAVWGGGTLPLRITYYLTEEHPPPAHVTSVRAVVLRGDSVLVVRDAEDSFHVVSGGRREEGEDLEETLRREVLEETGWTLAEFSLLAVTHFHHLAPKPAGYPYPHPDFLQIIYVARAGSFRPEARRSGEYEVESGFRALDEVEALALEQSQQLLLRAALQHR